MLPTLYYTVIHTLRLDALARRLRHAGVILCYHNVVPDEIGPPAGDPGLHMPLGRFRRQLEWLVQHYDLVLLRDFLHRLTGAPA